MSYFGSLDPLGHTVYVVRNADDEVIYVGCTLVLLDRISVHRADKFWFSEITRIELEHFADHDSAIARERALIEEHRPRYEWSPQSRRLRPKEWRDHQAGRDLPDPLPDPDPAASAA